MTIASTLEQVGYGLGAAVKAQHREVISGLGSARLLTPKESGSLVLLDRAAGIVITLPAPVLGMTFEFAATVSRTSNSYKVITNAATQFMVGAIMAGDAAIATSGDMFTADGTSHVAITCDGDTKGGLVGENYILTAISSTVWLITGRTVGTGTMVTPFTTS